MRREIDLTTGEEVEFPDADLPPPEPVIVPQVISKAQGLIALELAGLLDDIETYMSSAPKIEQIAWRNIQQFERASPLLNKLCGNFGLDSAAVDSLFISGAATVI